MSSNPCVCGGEYKFKEEFYVCDKCGEHSFGLDMSDIIEGVARLDSDPEFRRRFHQTDSKRRLWYESLQDEVRELQRENKILRDALKEHTNDNLKR